jgi:diguanylate cyclase (GGDEF)-like protein
METQDVLVVGSILLCCGCLGLLAVHLGTPILKGLGWLACSFVAGTLGVAAILAVRANITGSSFLIADTMVLLAYISLQVSICEIIGKPSRLPQLGLIMLAIQASLFPAFVYVHKSEQLSWVSLGLLLAFQSLHTATYLKKHIRRGMASSIWLSITLLVGFAAFNVVRSFVILMRGMGPREANPFEAASVIVYLATALGLGFSVFWMASMQLRLELETLAGTDPLTGLYNRRSFLSFCEQELQKSARTREQASLVLLDLDHFKQINDLHGHDGGDAALCAVAGRLKAALRENDILGRWGGEEFIVLLPGAGAEQAMQIAERLRVSIESLSIAHRTKEHGGVLPIRLATSAGVATAVGAIESIDALLSSCDEALYCAKAAGRNTVIHRAVPTGMASYFPLALRPQLS